MIYCRFCGKEIFWFLINGKNIPFENKDCTIRHNCPKLNIKKNLAKEDHILLTKTITRIPQLEKRGIELEKKSHGVNNEI